MTDSVAEIHARFTPNKMAYVMDMMDKAKSKAHLTPAVAPDKIGRDDQCPCGSGKKYKKCHLSKGEEP